MLPGNIEAANEKQCVQRGEWKALQRLKVTRLLLADLGKIGLALEGGMQVDFNDN